MDLNDRKRKIIAKWLIGIVAACILIYLGLRHIDHVATAVSWLYGLVSPLILGLFFALTLNVPMRFFESRLWKASQKPALKKLRRPVAFVISLALVIGAIVGIVWLVIPELVDAFQVVANGIVDLITNIDAMDKEALAGIPFGNTISSIDWDGILNRLQSWITTQGSNIADRVFGAIGSIVGGIFDFFIALIFAIYILFGKEKLKAQIIRLIKAWLPSKTGSWLFHATSIASSNFRNFVVGQTTEAIILGVLCMIGMLILRIPYAPMVGALVGVTAFLPIVGAWFGAIVGAFMILTVDPMKAFIFIIFLLILQQVEGNVIYPRVMGSRVNLPSIWILAAVTVGGGIAGPVGMLLSVPTASTLYVLVREATEHREQKRKSEMTDEEKDSTICKQGE